MMFRLGIRIVFFMVLFFIGVSLSYASDMESELAKMGATNICAFPGKAYKLGEIVRTSSCGKLKNELDATRCSGMAVSQLMICSYFDYISSADGGRVNPFSSAVSSETTSLNRADDSEGVAETGNDYENKIGGSDVFKIPENSKTINKINWF